MTVGGCLVQNDHELGEFKIFGVKRKKVSRVVTLDFKGANFSKPRKIVNSVPWESTLEYFRFHELITFQKPPFKSPTAGNPTVSQVNQAGQKTCLAEKDL